MKSLGYILWGSTVISVALGAFKSPVIWVGIALLALSLAYSVARVCLYRPPENHLGVVYQFDRFWRLVGSDEWIIVIPWVNEVKLPINLRLRRVEVVLSDLLPQDQVPVDCELVVYYRLDLRLARADFQPQALRIPDEGWNSIIRTVLRETANEVIGGATFEELLTPGGRGRFKRALSGLLAERVQGLGLIVNPRTGVSVQVLKPVDAVWQAMVDRLAAVSLGEAALDRVRPMLEELSQRHPEVAWEALLLQWAAAVVDQGNVPQVVVTPSDGLARGEGIQSAVSAALQTALREMVTPDVDHRAEASTIHPGRDGRRRAA